MMKSIGGGSFRNSFSAGHENYGTLIVDDVLKDCPNETPEQYSNRQDSTKYFLSAPS
jgi:hypothetical protein